MHLTQGQILYYAWVEYNTKEKIPLVDQIDISFFIELPKFCTRQLSYLYIVLVAY